jgi:hypothetical protein
MKARLEIKKGKKGINKVTDGNAQQDVYDAVEPFEFGITRRDIHKSKPQQEMFCALARGACHLVAKAKIGKRLVYLRPKGKNYWIRYAIQPDDVRKIEAFDRAKFFAPGRVTLVPPPNSRLGIHKGKHQGKTRHKGGIPTSRRPSLRNVRRTATGVVIE